MRLNNLSPADGSRKERTRVGRGVGSGLGKTAGRGHKGQKSRSGGFHKTGFEGGQMPIQRRLPKIGFRSLRALETAEIRTSELNQLDGVVSLETLKAAGLIRNDIRYVKIMLSGEVTKALEIQGVRVSKGARSAILAAGGKAE
ncbi:50S ribosomal protein L15 [Halothiobacillus diazotrophicus]|uniref:Large ribosomal subunit protein uL15 n=1 Tax=Halothiobacillus diazotrophicus TaxID=1860122 RepID=A0A191ZIS2_9GAMM|nr:50S ribosomal protein L15 [Halothiobacillus diazotrophicus]ANJ67775.1 50S ribosomal protein L15 [Halothiobacillus diazotrophicus]